MSPTISTATPGPTISAVDAGTTSDEEEGTATVRASRIEELFEWYVSDPTSESSLSVALERLITKTLLYPSDIVDHGPNLSPSRGRYALRPAIRASINSVVDRLQALLKDMAAELPRRQMSNLYYKVDAHKLITVALGGSASLLELQAVWDLLRERLKRGCRFIEKYLTEYKNEAVASPTSTTTTAMDQLLEETRSAQQVLQVYRTLIPSTLWTHSPGEAGTSQDAYNIGLHTQITVETASAFPEQLPRDVVPPYLYSIEGQRVPMPHAARSSIGENQFQLPPPPSTDDATDNRQHRRAYVETERGESEAEVVEAIQLRPESAPAELNSSRLPPLSDFSTAPGFRGSPTMFNRQELVGRSEDGPLIRGRNLVNQSMPPPPSFRGIPSYDVLTGAASALVSTVRRPYVQIGDKKAARLPLPTLREEG